MNFNEYRARYAELTDDEHRAAYAEWFRLYPSQKCCTLDALRRFVREHENDIFVEMGGWDGWAATAMLNEFKVAVWENIEICEEASERGPWHTTRYYRAQHPLPFRWWRQSSVRIGDDCSFVASHVIEHLSDDDARELISMLKPRAWYIEAPLSEDGQDWDNYNGSHVLRAGWKQLDAWLRDAGYEQAWAMGDARSYVRAR